MQRSFLWYDLETFGRDPRRSRIAQFAAIRTDENLAALGDPISLYCQPGNDLLPSPEATLITGITPQFALGHGLRESEFFAHVQDALAQPGTCAVGYNSLRFDDEFIRYGLYRNFHDPYEREWRNGNSRWDLLDFTRLVHALRPEGLEWPLGERGEPSFKLEHLAQANGLREGLAHEALSDVRALIGLARKLRIAQPKLWDYGLKLRDKRHVASLMDVVGNKPLLHISGRYPATRHCAALVLPLARNPRIDSRMVVFDLDSDPGPLLSLAAGDIADRLYTPAADLPEGESRIAIKEVHTNRCPVLVPLEHLRDADFQHLGIDRDACLARALVLRADAGLPEKIRQVFAGETQRSPADADAALYEGFPADADKRAFSTVRSSKPGALAALADRFKDPRYRELLFRYRARNWPDSLDDAEHGRWNDYRRLRLCHDRDLSEYTFESYGTEIATMRDRHPPGSGQVLLDALEAWGKDIEAQL